ncbi:uncharacterized protein LOC143373223 [Andrena cerasifolii]|uniref:uncharacterized protein LOC143373223 n=1 Tax=Andrena cerasifolii TaxID=2819439 RepID=UPI004037B776
MQSGTSRSDSASFSHRFWGGLLHSISAVALHALDVLLLVSLLPFMLWQWISASDRTKIVIKAILEVTLELLMWVVFAGVSILMTATFVVEDIYFRKNDTERLKQLLSAQSVPAGENPDDKNAHVSET